MSELENWRQVWIVTEENRENKSDIQVTQTSGTLFTTYYVGVGPYLSLDLQPDAGI